MKLKKSMRSKKSKKFTIAKKSVKFKKSMSFNNHFLEPLLLHSKLHFSRIMYFFSKVRFLLKISVFAVLYIARFARIILETMNFYPKFSVRASVR